MSDNSTAQTMNTTLRRLAAFAALALILSLNATLSTTFAGSHTWSGAVNGNWSNPGNWSSGGVPVVGEANLILTFPAGATRFTITNDIGALNLTALSLSGSGYTVRGAGALTFLGNIVDIAANGSTNNVESPVHFNSIGVVSVGPGDALVLAGAVSGTNGLAKIGSGDLYFKGAASNPLSGRLQVSYGELHFQKTGAASAYSGNQIEIGAEGVSELAHLELHASDSIPDGASLTFAPMGVLSMNGFSDVVGAVTMHGGIINGTPGGSLLRMDGTLTLTPRIVGTNMLGQLILESPTLWGTIQFGGTAGTIHVPTNVVEIEAVISEYSTASPINKTGPGQLTLAAANTFAGPLNVTQGTVFAEDVGALGLAAAGTVVASGASLKIPEGATLNEPLALNGAGVNGAGALQLDAGGNTTCAGSITLSNLARVFVPAAQQLQFTGVVGGPGGLEKAGPGELVLGGNFPNTFAGASFVNAGQLSLNKPTNIRAIGSVSVTNIASLLFNANEQMDNAGVLSIHGGALVNLLNRSETIGGLNGGAGLFLDTGTGTLTLLGGVYVGAPYNGGVGQPTIRGNLSLGGGTRYVETLENSLILDCQISDGAGVGGLQFGTATNTYNVTLLRSNSFSGPVQVGQGYLQLSNNFALGAPGGGLVGVGFASVSLLGATTTITGEDYQTTNAVRLSLFAYGTNAWNGRVGLSNNAARFLAASWSNARLTVNGVISGAGEVEIGFTDLDTVIFSQFNTYAGKTTVYPNAKLILQHPHALGNPDAQGTVLHNNATLELQLPDGALVAGEPLRVEAYTNFPGGWFTNATLLVSSSVSNAWTGPVTNHCPGFKLSVSNSAVLSIVSSITGPGAMEKNNPGALHLAGGSANTYTGDTVVNDGTLFLNKPNGVQAVGNLIIHAPGEVRWLASEQVADSATLRVRSAFFGGFTPRTNVFLFNHDETLTHLTTRRGVIVSENGSLGLLGDVDVTNDELGNGYGSGLLWAKLRLGPGPHLFFNTNANPDPNGFTAALFLFNSVSEAGGSASITTSNCVTHLYGSNSFTGPLVVNRKGLNIYHPNALGSPAQGTLLTNSAGVLLDMPNGSVLADEPLVMSPGVSPNGLIVWELTTNTWTGPITLLGENQIQAVGSLSKLILAGPIYGPAAITVSQGAGEVELAGPHTNTASGLNVYRGTVRLNKTPGAHAFTGLARVDGEEFDSVPPKLILGASGQFPPTTELAVGLSNGDALFDLNGHAATIAGLGGLGGHGTVNIGSGTLTIAPTAASHGFDGVVLANAGGPRLIKQGSGSQALFASFGNNAIAGDLLVQGGDLSLGDGTYGAVNIAAGATVGTYAFNASFGSLADAGNLETAYAGSIRVGENNASTMFSGVLRGNTPDSITKTGTGALSLTGTNTHTGTLRVEDGTLLVHGSAVGTVRVERGHSGQTPTLGGTGTLRNVVVTGLGASIAPGGTTGVPGYGRLIVTNIAINAGAIYRCEIGGTNAGVNLDQIDAKDTFTITGGLADFTAFGAGVVSNRYAVVKSFAAVSGTFTGDPEGDTIFPAAGRSMSITYLGGVSGRDIVLTDLSAIPPGSFGGIQMLPNGHVQVGGTGTPGVLYTVEANANLNTTNWLAIGTALANFNGAFSFVDTNAPSFPMRFYRFVLPPSGQF
jgi:autotransporter-associated beta strand protein